MPGGEDILGEVKACDGYTIPETVMSNSTYTISEDNILTITEPDTNAEYKLEGVPSAGYHVLE